MFLNVTWNYKTKTFRTCIYLVLLNEGWKNKDRKCWVQHFYWKKCYRCWWYRRLCKFAVSLTFNVFLTMSTKNNSTTKMRRKKLRTIWQNKLLCLMTVGLSAPLVDYYPNNCSETPNCIQNLEMIVLDKLQGTDPMSLRAPLANSKTNNSSKTSNYLQYTRWLLHW